MMALLVMASALWSADEAALREAFSKEIQAEAAAARVAAVKKLSGAVEEKTIELLTSSLKDKELAVRKAAVEALGASTDGGGVAIKPLGDILVDKKVVLDLRLACAKALVKSPYKGEVFQVLLKTMSSIESEEVQFHRFGFDVTKLLDAYIGRSYGADKLTCERWDEWWSNNGGELTKEDARRHEQWKKAGK